MSIKSYLAHYGITGQQWGVRRFQNPDGTLTPEGRQRYLNNGGLNEKTIQLYNDAADRMNSDLNKINKKYKGIDLNDDVNNLRYTKEIRDTWQKHYRDVLAKDLDTDPSTLSGQKWLDGLFGYKSGLDEEVADLEKKVKEKEKKESKGTTRTEIADLDKKTAEKIKENYSPKEMKETVKSIVEAFKDQGIDIFSSIKNPDKPNYNLKNADITEQFYVLMKLIKNDAFDDLT